MSEEIGENPFLKQENYFEGYNKSIDDLKNRPELIEFDKLIYEVFNTEMGKKLMELFEERYLIPALADRNAPNYQLILMWADGFKDAFRMIKHTIHSHEQRIKAEVNKNVG
jgi:hypothetical protein